VAVGAITEVVGKPKAAGKTTWVMHLVKAVLMGAAFMDSPTEATPVVYLTEERDSSLREALGRAGLLDRVDLHILRWQDTRGIPWSEIVHEAIAKCRSVGARLLVVDTVPQFAGLKGDAENTSGGGLEAYEPLQEAAAEGLAVVAIRHERKGGGDVGDSGRGSSAFAGAADIVLSIRRPEGHPAPGVRVIHALSRFEETPDKVTVELKNGGYVLGQGGAVAVAREAVLRSVPTNESQALTLDALANAAGVTRTTAQGAIDALVLEGSLQHVGKGVKGDPRRYFAARNDAAGTASLDAAETTARQDAVGGLLGDAR
jgi:hypothetical protein